MKNIVMLFLIVLLISGCSTQTPPSVQSKREVPQETKQLIEKYCDDKYSSNKKERRCRNNFTNKYQRGVDITQDNIDSVGNSN